MQQSGYRADIDGLRALAILPVVWFHAGLPGMPGGFTGVDIFFVISGFLISGIIHREIVENRFRVASFYERRLRRIAPALITVVAATLMAGLGLLLPYELDKLGQSAIAAILMVPNIYFWREAGYFALGATTTPLLHMWSLGVEEQFYILFPAFLLILERLKMVRTGLTFAALASFGLCVIATGLSPSFSFYMLPVRAWELALGALIGVTGTGELVVLGKARNVASVAGLALLLASLCMIDETDAFPGWLAMLPAAGSALLITSGRTAIANRAIANRAMVGIGKISYSLYLWHWPIFVYLRHYRANGHLPLSFAILGMTLAVVLSIFTYRYIEQPARRKSMSYRRIVVAAMCGSAMVVAVSLISVLLAGLPQRLPARIVEIASHRDDLSPLAHSCVNTPLERLTQDCRIGRGEATLLIWGDSHAAALSEGIASGLDRTALVASMNTCAPTLGWASSDLRGRDPATCLERNDQILKLILADKGLQIVVLSAYWPSYVRRDADGLRAGLQRLASDLRVAGKQVVILGGIPEPGFDVPWRAAIDARFGRSSPHWSCPPFVAPVRDVATIDLSAQFCAYSRPVLLFVDNNHPSRTANLQIVGPYLRSLAKSKPELGMVGSDHDGGNAQLRVSTQNGTKGGRSR